MPTLSKTLKALLENTLSDNHTVQWKEGLEDTQLVIKPRRILKEETQVSNKNWTEALTTVLETEAVPKPNSINIKKETDAGNVFATIYPNGTVLLNGKGFTQYISTNITEIIKKLQFHKIANIPEHVPQDEDEASQHKENRKVKKKAQNKIWTVSNANTKNAVNKDKGTYSKITESRVEAGGLMKTDDQGSQVNTNTAAHTDVNIITNIKKKQTKPPPKKKVKDKDKSFKTARETTELELKDKITLKETLLIETSNSEVTHEIEQGKICVDTETELNYIYGPQYAQAAPIKTKMTQHQIWREHSTHRTSSFIDDDHYNLLHKCSGSRDTTRSSNQVFHPYETFTPETKMKVADFKFTSITCPILPSQTMTTSSPLILPTKLNYKNHSDKEEAIKDEEQIVTRKNVLHSRKDSPKKTRAESESNHQNIPNHQSNSLKSLNKFKSEFNVKMPKTSDLDKVKTSPNHQKKQKQKEANRQRRQTSKMLKLTPKKKEAKSYHGSEDERDHEDENLESSEDLNQEEDEFQDDEDTKDDKQHGEKMKSQTICTSAEILKPREVSNRGEYKVHDDEDTKDDKQHEEKVKTQITSTSPTDLTPSEVLNQEDEVHDDGDNKGDKQHEEKMKSQIISTSAEDLQGYKVYDDKDSEDDKKHKDKMKSQTVSTPDEDLKPSEDLNQREDEVNDDEDTTLDKQHEEMLKIQTISKSDEELKPSEVLNLGEDEVNEDEDTIDDHEEKIKIQIIFKSAEELKPSIVSNLEEDKAHDDKDTEDDKHKEKMTTTPAEDLKPGQVLNEEEDKVDDDEDTKDDRQYENKIKSHNITTTAKDLKPNEVINQGEDKVPDDEDTKENQKHIEKMESKTISKTDDESEPKKARNSSTDDVDELNEKSDHSHKEKPKQCKKKKQRLKSENKNRRNNLKIRPNTQKVQQTLACPSTSINSTTTTNSTTSTCSTTSTSTTIDCSPTISTTSNVSTNSTTQISIFDATTQMESIPDSVTQPLIANFSSIVQESSSSNEDSNISENSFRKLIFKEMLNPSPPPQDFLDQLNTIPRPDQLQFQHLKHYYANTLPMPIFSPHTAPLTTHYLDKSIPPIHKPSLTSTPTISFLTTASPENYSNQKRKYVKNKQYEADEKPKLTSTNKQTAELTAKQDDNDINKEITPFMLTTASYIEDTYFEELHVALRGNAPTVTANDVKELDSGEDRTAEANEKITTSPSQILFDIKASPSKEIAVKPPEISMEEVVNQNKCTIQAASNRNIKLNLPNIYKLEKEELIQKYLKMKQSAGSLIGKMKTHKMTKGNLSKGLRALDDIITQHLRSEDDLKMQVLNLEQMITDTTCTNDDSQNDETKGKSKLIRKPKAKFSTKKKLKLGDIKNRSKNKIIRKLKKAMCKKNIKISMLESLLQEHRYIDAEKNVSHQMKLQSRKLPLPPPPRSTQTSTDTGTSKVEDNIVQQTTIVSPKKNRKIATK